MSLGTTGIAIKEKDFSTKDTTIRLAALGFKKSSSNHIESEKIFQDIHEVSKEKKSKPCFLCC